MDVLAQPLLFLYSLQIVISVPSFCAATIIVFPYVCIVMGSTIAVMAVTSPTPAKMTGPICRMTANGTLTSRTIIFPK